jgi:hypothetical protein
MITVIVIDPPIFYFMGLGPCRQACDDARQGRGMGFKKKSQVISIFQTGFSRMLAARRVKSSAHCDWSLDTVFGDGVHSTKAANQPIGARRHFRRMHAVHNKS